MREGGREGGREGWGKDYMSISLHSGRVVFR